MDTLEKLDKLARIAFYAFLYFFCVTILLGLMIALLWALYEFLLQWAGLRILSYFLTSFLASGIFSLCWLGALGTIREMDHHKQNDPQ